ncbi:MAG TPA: hypothetical protein VKV79_02075, partial [Terriglobia bacterium]|nr:hypothetical protein [Terriglobia bacterium]
RRRAACRANLLKAREATRAPDRPSHRGSFCHGLYNRSLRRSLIHAGESEAAFNAHLQLFVEAFGARSSDEVKLARALGEIVWRRWRALRCLSAWEAKSLYRRLAASRPPATAEAAASLAGDLFSVFYKAVGLRDSLHQLNRRFERVSRVLLMQRDPAERGSDFRWAAPRLPGESQMVFKPEPVLSNPFLTSRQVLQSLEAKPVRLAEIEQWQWKPVGVAAPVAPVSSPADEAAPQTILDFSQHRERFAAAFGLAQPASAGEAKAEGSEAQSWAALERCAELAWRRLPLLAAQAGQEEQALHQLFESRRGASPRQLAEAVLMLLGGGKLFSAAFDLQERFQDELHALLVARFGPHQAFDAFQPDQSGRMEDFVDALLAAAFGPGADDEPGGGEELDESFSSG